MKFIANWGESYEVSSIEDIKQIIRDVAEGDYYSNIHIDDYSKTVLATVKGGFTYIGIGRVEN